jgi:hypothetical protein
MALKDIMRASNRKRELDDEAIKEEIHNHLDEYRTLIAY